MFQAILVIHEFMPVNNVALLRELSLFGVPLHGMAGILTPATISVFSQCQIFWLNSVLTHFLLSGFDGPEIKLPSWVPTAVFSPWIATTTERSMMSGDCLGQ